MRRGLFLGVLVVVGCDCGTKRAGEPIARCADKSGDVRSHPAASTTWDPLAVGAMLEAGAWIQTAEASVATIQFLSGSELHIDPSSVVVLDAPDEEEEGGLVSLRSGTVRGAVAKAAPNRRIVVRTSAGKTMRIEPEAGKKVAYRLKVAEEGGDVELAVTSGRAKIVSEDGTEVSLEDGQVQSVSQGKLVGAIAQLPETPVPRDVKQVDERLHIRWAPSPRAAKYRVRVRSGGRTVVEEVVTKPELFVTQPPGEVEWTVTAIDEAGRESEPTATNRVTIREVVPDLLRAPAPDAVIRFSSRRPSVTFEWNGGKGMLVVGRDRELRDVAFSGEADGKLRTRALVEGTYWWTVKKADDTPLSPRPRRLKLKYTRRGIKLPRKLKWK